MTTLVLIITINITKNLSHPQKAAFAVVVFQKAADSAP